MFPYVQKYVDLIDVIKGPKVLYNHLLNIKDFYFVHNEEVGEYWNKLLEAGLMKKTKNIKFNNFKRSQELDLSWNDLTAILTTFKEATFKFQVGRLNSQEGKVKVKQRKQKKLENKSKTVNLEEESSSTEIGTYYYRLIDDDSHSMYDPILEDDIIPSNEKKWRNETPQKRRQTVPALKLGVVKEIDDKVPQSKELHDFFNVQLTAKLNALLSLSRIDEEDLEAEN